MHFPPRPQQAFLRTRPPPPHLPRSPVGGSQPALLSGGWLSHSLKMTMDKEGLLLLSSPDKVTIGLLSWNGPGQGIRLLLRDTDRFSSHVNGTLGMLPVAWLRASSETTSACRQAVPHLCVSPSLLMTSPLSLRPVLPGCALGTLSSR